MKEVYFDRYVDKKGPNDCWEWTSNKNYAGYGRLTKRFGKIKTTFTAHRIAWMFHYNTPIPPTLLCCHLCDNPPCVNPLHIMIGTYKANMQDAMLKGRFHGWAPARAGKKRKREQQ